MTESFASSLIKRLKSNALEKNYGAYTMISLTLRSLKQNSRVWKSAIRQIGKSACLPDIAEHNGATNARWSHQDLSYDF
jgi:hypothetical protein